MGCIPTIRVPERYEARDFIDSRFIEIVPSKIFDVQMQYPLLNMKNAEKRCYVREEVYKRLIKAARTLPKGYKFRILDAWRPFLLQNELYSLYSFNIIKDLKLEDCTEDQKRAVISKFISNPVEDREIPPVHTTGGAIDLTIIDAYGKELDMGTGFDSFSDKAYTAFFEQENSNDIVRTNRRLLYYVMTSVGFTNLPSEWWHFDYGDRFWAFYTKRPAIYKGVFVKEEIYDKR